MKYMSYKVFGILFLGLIFVPSCSNDDCMPVWTVTKEDPSALVEISEQEEWLSLQVYDATKGLVAEVSQSNAGGSYEIFVTFENFQSPSNGGGGYAEMTIYSVVPADSILDTTSVTVGVDANNLYTAFASIDRTEKPYTYEAGNMGYFHIKKTAVGVSMEVIFNEDTLKTFHSGATSANILAFRIGSYANYLPGVLGIKIARVEIIKDNSIQVVGDDFKCNTFFPPEEE